jgi:hypothetical protein
LDLLFLQELFIPQGLINRVTIFAHPQSRRCPNPLHPHPQPHFGHRPHIENFVGFISKWVGIL